MVKRRIGGCRPYFGVRHGHQLEYPVRTVRGCVTFFSMANCELPERMNLRSASSSTMPCILYDKRFGALCTLSRIMPSTCRFRKATGSFSAKFRMSRFSKELYGRCGNWLRISVVLPDWRGSVTSGRFTWKLKRILESLIRRIFAEA